MDQAEGLRNIIKKQKIESAKRTARVITVTSGKGGVGKSSITLNLAILLSRMGHRVIVLDADFGLANIEIMLGIRPKYNLSDLIYHGKVMRDIISYGPEGVGFISGGSGIQEMANLTRDQVYQLIQKMEELDRLADIILIDTGAGVGDAVLEFVAASEEVLLVATPEPTSITDAYALLKLLNRNASFHRSKTEVKMIANQTRDNREANALFEKMGEVISKFLNIEVEYLGGIPYDSNMPRAIMRQEPISIAAPGSQAARSLEQIASKLDSQESSGRRLGIMQLFTSVIRMRFHKN